MNSKSSKKQKVQQNNGIDFTQYDSSEDGDAEDVENEVTPSSNPTPTSNTNTTQAGSGPSSSDSSSGSDRENENENENNASINKKKSGSSPTKPDTTKNVLPLSIG